MRGGAGGGTACSNAGIDGSGGNCAGVIGGEGAGDRSGNCAGVEGAGGSGGKCKSIEDGSGEGGIAGIAGDCAGVLGGAGAGGNGAICAGFIVGAGAGGSGSDCGFTTVWARGLVDPDQHFQRYFGVAFAVYRLLLIACVSLRLVRITALYCKMIAVSKSSQGLDILSIVRHRIFRFLSEGQQQMLIELGCELTDRSCHTKH